MVAGSLAVVLGAVQSGRLSGLQSLGGPPIPRFGLNSTLPGGPSPWAAVMAGANSSIPSVTSTAPSGGGTGASVFVPPGLSIPGWYVYVLLGAAVILGAVFLTRRGGGANAIGFPAIHEELEAETRRVLASWSSGLRNAALVRYYSLVRRACAMVGIEDVPAETPREYLERVATELKLNRVEARSFAGIFNRARYGQELSELEGREASEFMGSFVEVIRERTSHG